MVIARLLWEILVQAAHSLLPRLTTGRRSPEGRDEDFLAMRIYSRLAYVYWFSSGKFMCAWSHFRGLNLAERYPPSAELGQACSEHAPVMTMLPWYERSLRYARRSLEIRRARNDPWGQGQSHGFAGVTLYAASRYDEGADACREAIRLLKSTGDQWEVNTASWNLAMCLYRKGDLAAAVEVARATYNSAMAIGDETSAGVALSVWTRASGGRVDPTLIDVELARNSSDVSTTAELRFAAAVCAIRGGDLGRAAEEAARGGGHGPGRRPPPGVRRPDRVVERHHRAAGGRAGLGLRRGRPRPAAAGVCDARTTGAVLGVQLSQQRPARPPRGRPARQPEGPAAQGDPAPGAQHGDRGCPGSALRSWRSAGRHGPRSWWRGGELRRAAGRRDRGRPRASSASLEPRPAEDEVDPTVSLFDRFTTLLSVGREIAAAPSTAALEAVIRHAALTLLRGERCHIISVEDVRNDNLVTVSGERADAISHTLLDPRHRRRGRRSSPAT